MSLSRRSLSHVGGAGGQTQSNQSIHFQNIDLQQMPGVQGVVSGCATSQVLTLTLTLTLTPCPQAVCLCEEAHAESREAETRAEFTEKRLTSNCELRFLY